VVCVLNGSGGGVVSCNNDNVVVIFSATVAMVLSSTPVTDPSLYATIFLFVAATVQQT